MPVIDYRNTVAGIVAAHPATARAFQRYGIDFCCHGDVVLEAACAEHGLDSRAVAMDLEAIVQGHTPEPGEDARELSTPALIARIIGRHHAYLRETLPSLGVLVEKIARVHGPKNPKLVQLRTTYDGLVAALDSHLRDEEEVLFPTLMSRTPDPGIVATELSRMLAEHLAVGDTLADLRSLSDGYAVPEWGCGSYRAAMGQLEQVEADLLRHVHLENHVLMPRFVSRQAAA